jgi:hypothetical protein
LGIEMAWPAAHPHPRPFQTVRVMVQEGQSATLCAGVTVRKRVVSVAADTDHVLAVDVDEDAADRGTDLVFENEVSGASGARLSYGDGFRCNFTRMLRVGQLIRDGN